MYFSDVLRFIRRDGYVYYRCEYGKKKETQVAEGIQQVVKITGFIGVMEVRYVGKDNYGNQEQDQ
jgi:hypothetical protein